MRIKVTPRVKPSAEEVCRKMVRDLQSGSGPLLPLASDRDLLSRVAAACAPYGKAARDEYFRQMRALADRLYPCQYS